MSKKDNYDRIAKLKQDLFKYVESAMKIERKEARKMKLYISRPYTRYQIWVYFVTFCRSHFGTEYLTDIDNNAEINIIHKKDLTFKNFYVEIK
jgi:hypothetical protein